MAWSGAQTGSRHVQGNPGSLVRSHLGAFEEGLDRLRIAAVSSKLCLDYRVGQNKAPYFAAAPSRQVDCEISQVTHKQADCQGESSASTGPDGAKGAWLFQQSDCQRASITRPCPALRGVPCSMSGQLRES